MHNTNSTDLEGPNNMRFSLVPTLLHFVFPRALQATPKKMPISPHEPVGSYEPNANAVTKVKGVSRDTRSTSLTSSH